MTSLRPFHVAWWLDNPHLQSIWPTFARNNPPLKLRHERFELSDNDFVDLSWGPTGNRDIVILLHGLGGSVASSYMRGMMHALWRKGFHTVAMHFRNCSNEVNRHFRTFHAGQTCDVLELIQHLRRANTKDRIFAVGFSIGSNVLLKLLGEQGEKCLLNGACGISTPFHLGLTQATLSRGFSRIYQLFLLNKLKSLTFRKYLQQKHHQINYINMLLAKNIKEFDRYVTVPMHGFRSADDYYEQASSLPFLKAIGVPTLIIHAKDDPFMPSSIIPSQNDVSPWVDLFITEKGGHLGFVGGPWPQKPEFWLETVVPEYFLGL